MRLRFRVRLVDVASARLAAGHERSPFDSLVEPEVGERQQLCKELLVPDGPLVSSPLDSWGSAKMSRTPIIRSQEPRCPTRSVWPTR